MTSTTPARRALITCADRYMGRAIATKFRQLSIDVIEDDSPLTSNAEVDRVVAEAGRVDILVANLAEPPMTGPVHAIDDANWQRLFVRLVDPLMYLVRAVTPQMLERQSGKIIAVTSAAPLKGIANNAAYCAARARRMALLKRLDSNWPEAAYKSMRLHKTMLTMTLIIPTMFSIRLNSLST